MQRTAQPMHVLSITSLAFNKTSFAGQICRVNCPNFPAVFSKGMSPIVSWRD
jgi:hypothetical protein